MERIVDLDLAAAEITTRRPVWAAAGLDVGPLTWRDEAAPWPQRLETDRVAVADPDSVGVLIHGPGDTELLAVLFRGGWADVDYYAGGEDGGTVPAPHLASAEAFGHLLDSCVARVFASAVGVDA